MFGFFRTKYKKAAKIQENMHAVLLFLIHNSNALWFIPCYIWLRSCLGRSVMYHSNYFPVLIPSLTITDVFDSLSKRSIFGN